jgi:glucose/arabinose dehydrogenase
VPYTAEHGPNINDEINQLVAGGNGGWDPNTNGNYDQFVPMTDLLKFPDAMIPAWRSGDSFTLAPSGCTFLQGAQWKAWDGALLVAFLKDSKARVMFLDGSGNVDFATPILANGVRLRSAVQGPDGNLYISTDVGGGGGAIWKVVPS